MCLVAVREVEHPHTVGLIRCRLHQDGPDGVDETLAFSCERVANSRLLSAMESWVSETPLSYKLTLTPKLRELYQGVVVLGAINVKLLLVRKLF